MDSGPDNITSVSTSDPWSGQAPFLSHAFGEAERLYGTGGPSYFPNSTVTPFAQETEQSLQGRYGRAQSGSPLLQAGQDQTRRTASGEYLQAGNPHIQGVVDRFHNLINPQVKGAFAAAGGQGGSAGETQAYSQALSDAVAPYLFNSYESERGRMQDASQISPMMASADFMDYDQMALVGAEREGLGERQLQDQIARHDFGQQRPYSNLGAYLGFLGGNYGGTQTTQQPLYRNRASGALGGALGGAGLGQMLGAQNPWLWAGGGGLLGALG